MQASADLKDVLAWFKEHKAYIVKNGVAGLIEGFTAQLDSIEVATGKVEELETLVHSAHEFMTGEWEPDDVDRAKFTKRLEDAVNEEDDE